MQLIEFPEQTVVIAKDQPQYNPLPAHIVQGSDQGEIICCWQLTWRERLRVLFRGRVWHHILTFYRPLQPQRLAVEKPTMVSHAVRRCRVCGCTDMQACEGSCWWVAPDLCSRCAASRGLTP